MANMSKIVHATPMLFIFEQKLSRHSICTDPEVSLWIFEPNSNELLWYSWHDKRCQYQALEHFDPKDRIIRFNVYRQEFQYMIINACLGDGVTVCEYKRIRSEGVYPVRTVVADTFSCSTSFDIGVILTTAKVRSDNVDSQQDLTFSIPIMTKYLRIVVDLLPAQDVDCYIPKSFTENSLYVPTSSSEDKRRFLAVGGLVTGGYVYIRLST
jgi:hypothetical protein